MSADTYDLGCIAYGIDRVERARTVIHNRTYTDKPGHDWTPQTEGWRLDGEARNEG